jgi:1,4-alpha-glucan branching enzyme
MHDVRPLFPPNRYSAKRMAKPINFVCIAPTAQQVRLTGDFNGWDPEATPMQRQPDGTWLVQVAMHHGHHHYLFLIDGKATLDPRAQGVARNRKGEPVSLMAVS